jgi:hypothetical protein
MLARDLDVWRFVASQRTAPAGWSRAVLRKVSKNQSIKFTLRWPTPGELSDWLGIDRLQGVERYDMVGPSDTVLDILDIGYPMK